jgi:glycosyltransferase involved in cell wall biosynthesis
MRISVVIPTYNSTGTIEATLDSVLRQTVPPDEIIVLDDGSTDDTVARLRSYEPKITLIEQKNSGVAAARNRLCEIAQGELIAFLDHDDIWHPTYLAVQAEMYGRYPQAVAFIAGHVNFTGSGGYRWLADDGGRQIEAEVYTAKEFLERYNRATGDYGSMSFCCVPKRVLAKIGSNPFCVDGVDDSYLCTTMPLVGEAIVYIKSPLVAYRIGETQQSADKLKMLGRWVKVFELLEPKYKEEATRGLCNSFGGAFASKQRSYAKLLMGANRKLEARAQLWQSLGSCQDWSSRAKSLGLLFTSCLPATLQPSWPSASRRAEGRSPR